MKTTIILLLLCPLAALSQSGFLNFTGGAIGARAGIQLEGGYQAQNGLIGATFINLPVVGKPFTTTAQKLGTKIIDCGIEGGAKLGYSLGYSQDWPVIVTPMIGYSYYYYTNGGGYKITSDQLNYSVSAEIGRLTLGDWNFRGVNLTYSKGRLTTYTLGLRIRFAEL